MILYNHWIKTLLTLLLIVVSVLVVSKFINGNKNSVTHHLYASNYKPYPNLIDPITKGNLNEKSPFQLYESGKYKQALEGLQKMTNDEDALWYACQCKIALGLTKKGIDCLNDSSMQESKYKFHIDWYLAMVYLEIGEKEKASSSLKKIISEKTRYTKNATALLNKLKG